MSDNLRDDLARILVFRLDEIGMTQVELAKRAGMARDYVCQVVNGRRNVTLHTAERLLNAVGLDAVLKSSPHNAPPSSDS